MTDNGAVEDNDDWKVSFDMMIMRLMIMMMTMTMITMMTMMTMMTGG